MNDFHVKSAAAGGQHCPLLARQIVVEGEGVGANARVCWRCFSHSKKSLSLVVFIRIARVLVVCHRVVLDSPIPEFRICYKNCD
jgi:hypothetical protein